MVTSLDIPDHWLPWMDSKQQEMNLRSRRAFILAAIERLAMVPPVDKPKAEDIWPIKDFEFVCPECSGTFDAPKHCGGGERLITPEKATKTRRRWICVCPHCVPSTAATAASRETTPQLPPASPATVATFGHMEANPVVELSPASSHPINCQCAECSAW